MRILGIDPGSEKSAVVIWDTDSETVELHSIIENERVLVGLRMHQFRPDEIGIEIPRGFGGKAGNEIYDTCIWSGRFDEAAKAHGYSSVLLGRKEIVTHLCDSSRAGDKDVREAIMYRFGGKVKAIGCKKDPGPLFGIKADEWSALAVCLFLADREAERVRRAAI